MSVKHGGGLESKFGVEDHDLPYVEGIMKAGKYKQISIPHAMPSGKGLDGKKFILR